MLILHSHITRPRGARLFRHLLPLLTLLIVASGLVLAARPASAQIQTYRDEFSATAYDGTNGSMDWSPEAWQEESESDGTGNGFVRVVSSSYCASGNCLRLEGDNPSKDYAARRTLDLTGGTAATLSYNYRRQNYWSCRTRVQVRSSDAASWTTLATYGSNGGDPGQQSASHDISSYIASTTQIRFISTDYCDTGEYFYADNVQVEGSGVFPVELTAFEAVADGEDVELAWKTASETNNAGFEVQQQTGGGWQVLGFVEGRGTTVEAQRYAFRAEALAPGRHVFRLRQIDYDGTFEIHPEVEVVVDLQTRLAREPAYPNPFNPEARFRFAVRTARPVDVGLYDVLGRRVQDLYRGTPEPDQMQTVRIDGHGLPSGVYVVRLASAHGVASQTVTLLR
ncbi:MAG: T9SS type A sorting domain-containing protein [Rhodothermales bacterium]|nr:T9SS type A sorting domain-containing protein [Rhodothermales bacterium]